MSNVLDMRWRHQKFSQSSMRRLQIETPSAGRKFQFSAQFRVSIHSRLFREAVNLFIRRILGHCFGTSVYKVLLYYTLILYAVMIIFSFSDYLFFFWNFLGINSGLPKYCCTHFSNGKNPYLEQGLLSSLEEMKVIQDWLTKGMKSSQEDIKVEQDWMTEEMKSSHEEIIRKKVVFVKNVSNEKL